MLMQTDKPLARACAGLVLAGFLAASGSAAVARTRAPRAQRSAFALLEGTWSGTGAVTTSNGQSERVRCRATYSLSGAENVLTQSLVCASASFRFNVSSQITDQGGAISGQWNETTRGVGGAVKGTLNGNQINTTVSGQGFSATLIVNVGSNSHNVTIQPQGTDIAAVQMSFRRAGG